VSPDPLPKARIGSEPHDPLQFMLVGVWEEVLGIGSVGVDRTFAELGGTQERLAQMWERAATACGRPVPPQLRRLEVTVEELAAALRDPAGSKETTRRAYTARNVSTPTGRPPLFFLHGDWGGGGLYCLQLAVHLGRDQPLYALAPHGLDGEPLPPSVEAMAADRIETLRQLQPAGPYRLGGHCNGAVVAFEMARQLHSQGESVERLVLVAPVVFLQQVSLAPPSLADSVRRVKGLSPRALAATVRDGLVWRLKSLAPRIMGHRWVPQPESRSEAVVKAAATRDRLYVEYSRRMRAYRPAPYPGAVTVLYPREDGTRPGADPSQIWSRLAASVETHAIPGEHLSCITIHVRDLARRIRTCLDEPGPPS